MLLKNVHQIDYSLVKQLFYKGAALFAVLLEMLEESFENFQGDHQKSFFGFQLKINLEYFHCTFLKKPQNNCIAFLSYERTHKKQALKLYVFLGGNAIVNNLVNDFLVGENLLRV